MSPFEFISIGVTIGFAGLGAVWTLAKLFITLGGIIERIDRTVKVVGDLEKRITKVEAGGGKWLAIKE